MGMTPSGPGFRLPFLSRARVTADVEAELAFHLAMVANDLEQQGWSRADAELEARRRFGDIEFTRHYCGQQDLKRQRERNRMARIDELGKDVRYTMRSLRKAPGFALVVLLTLALGIGANTAIFSVVRAVLLEPLPFRDADRLVRVWHENKANGVAQGLVSEPDFLDWRRETKVAESMGAYWNMDGRAGVDMTGDGPPQRLSSALVAEGFFETLGASPLLGRTITKDDQLEGRNRVVVIGFNFWRDRFNSDPNVLGRTLQISNAAFTVIGVMPEHFAYPNDRNLDVWIPLSFFGPDNIGRGRGAQFQQVVARLRPGATEAQLRDELSSIAARLTREYPDNAGYESVTVMSMRESIVGNVQRPLALLLGAVFLVLLITCANIASLLLARATSRRRELAVRAALGAGRARITRQLLTESLVLAVAGGLLGTILAYWATRVIAQYGETIPRTATIGIDGTVLAFTLGISLLAGVMFGVAPALRATGASLDKVLRAGGRGNIGVGMRLRSGLVVIQVALAVVLVTAAVLTTKSFSRLLSVDLGFNPSNVLFVEISIPDKHSEPFAVRNAYYQGILDAIAAVPGVTAAGAIRDLPTRGKGEVSNVRIAGVDPTAGGGQVVQYHQVSRDYFRAMEIPVRTGRGFTEQDRLDAPLVAIVDEEFVRRFPSNQDPLSRRLLFGTTEVPIVGVVGSVRQAGAAQAIEPAVYLHAMQSRRSRMSIVVRTSGDPLASANAVRQAIWSMDKDQAIQTVAPLEDILGSSVARPRLLASLFAMFGILGLSLGALGVYGILAFSVQQRQQEIGVRVALGASPRSVQGMIIRQGLVLAGSGVLIGLVGSLAATGVIQGVLYGIEAVDVATFAQVVLAVVITAVIASWVPARRATTIDPMTALRNE